MLTLFKSGAYMALKVDIWPPLPLETDKMPPTWLFVWSLERPPPLLWQPETPRMASKDCVVGSKKATYMPPLTQGSSKWTPTWAYVCTKTPLHEKVLHSSKYTLQTPAPESRMPRTPPPLFFFFGENAVATVWALLVQL